jgi:flavin-dependent trigonelline monooxygenase, reductase component
MQFSLRTREHGMNQEPHDAAQMLDAKALRRVFGTFLTGVTVVTTVDQDGRKRGFTANSYTSVSLDPPIVLACLDRRSANCEAFMKRRGFAINVLADHQKHLSNLFASKSADKFEGLRTSSAWSGSPILPDVVGWIDCALERTLDVGDHVVLIGQVKAVHDGSGMPLGYFRGNYVAFSLEQKAVLPSVETVFGCIVEYNGRILLKRSSGGNPCWSIPKANWHAAGGLLGGLPEILSHAGAPADLSFLYSVFEVPEQKRTYIVYRGVFHSEPKLGDSSRWALFDNETLPWNALKCRPIETMLQRYFRERNSDRFGIYVDSKDGGRIAMPHPAPAPFSKLSTGNEF